MKKCYDEFKEGLTLLPMPSQPLRSRYSGPFQVIKRVSDVNCILATPHRRKKRRLVHVNLLKMYHVMDDQIVKDGITGDTKDVAVILPRNSGDDGNERIVPVIEPNLSNMYLLNNLEQKLTPF